MKKTESLKSNDKIAPHDALPKSGGANVPRWAVDLSTIFEGSPIAFYSTDSAGQLLTYNEAAVRIWGRRPEVGGDLWQGLKIFYSDGRPMPLEECPMIRTLKYGRAHDNEKVVIERPDRTISNLLVFPRPVFDEHGKLLGAHNTLVDITDQQKSEMRKATLSAIVESSDDAIVSKDLNGIIRTWNAGAQRIFGYTENEVIGKSITLIIPEDRLAEEKLIIESIKKGKKVNHFETFRLGKNGQQIPISLTISPVRNSQGEVVGASKIARDISAQLKAQQEIKSHNRKLEILNSIGKSISRNMDVKAILQHVTDATTQLTGAAFGAFFYNDINEQGESYRLFTLSGTSRKPFEKIGMPRKTKLFDPTFSGEGVVRVDDITEDPRYGQNTPHFGIPKEHPKVVSYMAVPVVSPSGTVIGGLFFGHPDKGIFTAEHEDMIVNIAAQAAISLDNSKLFEQVKSLSEKKDEFIALASHELKTPLTTIKGYLQLLSEQETDQMSELFLKKTLHQVNKLNTLVEDLLHMSRIEAGKLGYNTEIFDLRKMLVEIVETFSYSYKTHEVISDLGELPAFVEGDKQRIEQVILNLMTNAVKYSPGADKVYLGLATSEEGVTVSVRDEGIGLTEAQKEQIFTRFYRAENTKGISGLGLGLYLSKQIIDLHKGEMDVKSEFGKGSEFFFTLRPQKK